jgi:peptidoglycan/LPS O-acetylase OafA/YrhL
MVVYTDSLINFGALAFGGWLGMSLPRKAGEGTRSWPGLAGLGLIVLFIVGFNMLGVFQRGTAMMVAIGPLVAATLFGGLFVAGVYLNQRSLLARVLELPWIRGFGRISYGFYLYHNLLPHWILFRLTGWRAPEWLEAGLSFGLGLGLAMLSWKLVEQPLLKLKDRPPRFLAPRAAPSPT